MPATNARLLELLRYLDFTPDDAAALEELRVPLERTRDALVDEFYRRLLADAGALEVMRDQGRIDGLKVSLRDWIERLPTEAIDDAWLARRAAIGKRHVQVGLPQRYMPLAMGVVREHLVNLAVAEYGADCARLARALNAVNKALDLELTVMLDTYHADTITKLRQVERLQTITRLAAGVSHELKNPLGVINTSLLLLRRLLADPLDAPASPVSEHLDRMGRASRQAAEMTDQLLDYSHVRTISRQRVPVVAMVDDAVAMLDALDHVRIERAGSLDATMQVDPVALIRVLSNLLRNAVQSIAQDRSRREPGVVVIRWGIDGDMDTLEVQDNGPGVPESIRDRIFEPLFTTRTHGTGLGLAICRDIVFAHGGSLELVPAGAPGATFRVRLPRTGV